MSKIKEQKTWTTDDGQEFISEAEAAKHAEFMTAKDNYDRASRTFGSLLAQRQKTADGKPFEFGILRDYWFVRNFMNSIPSLGQASFYFWSWSVDSRDDCIVLMEKETGDKRGSQHRIDQLYATEQAAQKALLVAQEQFATEMQKRIEHLRSKVES